MVAHLCPLHLISKNDIHMYGQVDVVSPDKSDKIAPTLLRVLPSGFHKSILQQSWTWFYQIHTRLARIYHLSYLLAILVRKLHS